MKLKIVLPLLLLVAALSVGGTFYFTHNHEETEVGEEGVLLDTETTISTDIIKSGLRDIGEMATEEYYYTGVETYDSTKKLGKFDVPLTKSSFAYSYDGTIKAGIDFTEIEIEKDDLKKLVTVTLPAAKILSAEIDEESFKLFDEKTSIFNPVSVSDMNDTLIELEATAKERAVEKGVLERADKNAQDIIRNFIKSLGVSDYTVKFVTAEEQ